MAGLAPSHLAEEISAGYVVERHRHRNSDMACSSGGSRGPEQNWGGGGRTDGRRCDRHLPGNGAQDTQPLPGRQPIGVRRRL